MDKRSKKYKEWKAKMEASPNGIGDTIETITKATGIDKVAKIIFGDDCGCEERKQKLNRSFSYKPKGCFTEEQYNQWTEFRNRKNQNSIEVSEQKLIATLLKDIYKISIKQTCASCSGSTYKKWIDMINKFYETYQ